MRVLSHAQIAIKSVNWNGPNSNCVLSRRTPKGVRSAKNSVHPCRHEPNRSRWPFLIRTNGLFSAEWQLSLADLFRPPVKDVDNLLCSDHAWKRVDDRSGSSSLSGSYLPISCFLRSIASHLNVPTLGGRRSFVR
ncbi:hypothetical protein RRSWK_06386 [Rhodopirellula sp. SWK7]|nr:hypothetical protein RRSWK_06386 [Rhodopirellula sp. SWK7]